MPELVKMLKDTILSNSPIGTCGAILATVGRTDATPSLSKINIPTLILVGEDDILTPPSICKIMHQKIPGSKMQVISDAGHMSNLENPDEFNRHLLDFLLLST